MSVSLPHADTLRREVSLQTSDSHKAIYGQYMTPAATAAFMASMFELKGFVDYKILDAGAGVGSLTCALVDRISSEQKSRLDHVEITAVELDKKILAPLQHNLSFYPHLRFRVLNEDFLEYGLNETIIKSCEFTHVIMNPPYKKINTKSKERLLLRTAGIETVNLYSGFIAIALMLLKDKGELVAIVPRSFCNGAYYKPFREFVLKNAAIQQIHLFDSRTKMFSDEGVLQENVIIRLQKNVPQQAVSISTSSDDSFRDLTKQQFDFDKIVLPYNIEKFIHIPTSTIAGLIESSDKVNCSLVDLGIKASTGPVVDFRAKDELRDMPVEGSVPLLYPIHFKNDQFNWPDNSGKKPNALIKNQHTERSLYPNGFYCVVRRFSSKEEKRRIVPSLISPAMFKGYDELAFENHLNVFHQNKKGLSENLAKGLTVFLSSTAVDDYFRKFNGHTQVNATDLKTMRYPSLEILEALGAWFNNNDKPSQLEIDKKVKELL